MGIVASRILKDDPVVGVVPSSVSDVEVLGYERLPHRSCRVSITGSGGIEIHAASIRPVTPVVVIDRVSVAETKEAARVDVLLAVSFRVSHVEVDCLPEISRTLGLPQNVYGRDYQAEVPVVLVISSTRIFLLSRNLDPAVDVSDVITYRVGVVLEAEVLAFTEADFEDATDS